MSVKGFFEKPCPYNRGLPKASLGRFECPTNACQSWRCWICFLYFIGMDGYGLENMKQVPLRSAVGWMLALLMLGCSDPTPINIGFIGPTSGRSADLGIAGRNGAILAIEQINEQGGIDGRLINLIVRDDEQSAERGSEIIREFEELKVDAILGPFTSNVTLALMPQINNAQITTMAVTVTSDLISGKDDYILRTVSSTADHAARHGAYHYKQLGFRNAHVILDMANEAYTRSWYNDYSRGFTQAGGQNPQETTFSTGNDVNFDAIAEQVLSSNPDLVVFCTNSVDAAALAKAIRLQNDSVQIATSEWAGTERLISLGGQYVENILVPQYLNRQDDSETYQAFRRAYMARFNQQEPGFAGKIAYSGAKVLARAFAEQQSGEELKDTIVRLSRFEGLQGDIVINATGDSRSETFVSRIKNGQFISQVELQ